MRKALFVCAFAMATRILIAQTADLQLPCPYQGDVLRNAQGDIVSLSSAQMKARTTRKVEMSDLMKRVDFKGTIVERVLVAPDGHVICTKVLFGFPLIAIEVDKALKQWTFRPAEAIGKRVAILGVLQFNLCNTSCGKDGVSTGLVR